MPNNVLPSSNKNALNQSFEWAPDVLNLNSDTNYRRWRDWKLSNYPKDLDDLIVEIDDPYYLKEEEIEAIRSCCNKTNFAIYEFKNRNIKQQTALEQFTSHFGLKNADDNLYAIDGMTTLHVTDAKRQSEYIPYTKQALNWHTDGYYNPVQQQVRAFLLHCISPADYGGENALLDHEIAYIFLRDANPDYIKALSQHDIMTIPANEQDGDEIRPEYTGPVFSIDYQTRRLHMRFTMRKRYISWHDDDLSQTALNFLKKLLKDGTDYTFKHRLQSGQGIICNNILHNRTAFQESDQKTKKRLFYRARYYQRIT